MKDNAALDYGVAAPATPCSASVIEGMDVVDKIVAVRTTTKARRTPNVPVTPVVIKTARLAQ